MDAAPLATAGDLARIRSRARGLGLTPANRAAGVGRKEVDVRNLLSGHIPMSRSVRAKLIELLGLDRSSLRGLQTPSPCSASCHRNVERISP